MKNPIEPASDSAALPSPCSSAEEAKPAVGADALAPSVMHETVLASLAELVAGRREQCVADTAAQTARLLATPLALPGAQRRTRRRLAAMLGWPLSVPASRPVGETQIEDLPDDLDWARLSRIWFEVTDGFRAYALVCVPKKAPRGRRPLLVFQHGGWGSPEQVVGLQGPSNYHAVVRQAAERGWIVVVPQLLIWQQKFPPHIDQFRVDQDLKQLGGSRVALDTRILQRAAEETAAHFPVKPRRWAVAGLSYGGFYALLAAALDPRFRAVLSSCYVNDRIRYNWTDWVWFDSARQLDDTLLALLIHPRPLFVEAGVRDDIFDIATARPVLRSIAEAYAALGTPDAVVCREFDGAHEICPDGAGVDFLTAALARS